MSSIIKLAQYLSSLTIHQDVYMETSSAIINFIGFDFVAFGRRLDGKGDVITDNWCFRDSSNQELVESQELRDVVSEVLDSGFLAHRSIDAVSARVTCVFVPIAFENNVNSVMLAGYMGLKLMPQEVLDLVLAAAKLTETTISRITSEKELRVHRQDLEDLVASRTSDLLLANRRLQDEVNQRRRIEEALISEKTNLMKILEAMDDAVCIVDTNHVITYANPAFKRAFPDPDHGMCYERLDNGSEPCPDCRIGEVLSGDIVRLEWNCMKNDRTYDLVRTPYRDNDGVTSALTIFRDITDRKRAEDSIRQLAYYDGLTGLPNRTLFLERLKLELSHSLRNKQYMALAMLDLDYFKSVNDSLGHDMGDKLLTAVGERLVRILRKSDTVARFGGDEFILILPHLGAPDDAVKTANKLLRALEPPFTLDCHRLTMTVSIGISVFPCDGEDSTSLIKHADYAMYYAKREGRARFVLYSSCCQKIVTAIPAPNAMSGRLYNANGQ